jgi:signal peptidase
VAAGVTAHFMGITAYVITGASMTGAIPKGSLAFERNVPQTALAVGDIITFRAPDNGGNVTHRIIEVAKDKSGQPVFRTKGDYNEVADPWLFSLDKEVQARYMFHVPYIGYALASFTLRWVRTGILVLVGLLIVGITLMWLRRNPKEDEPGTQRINYYKTGEAAR